MDRINKFINDNELSIIIRSHEPVRDGYEKMNCNIVTLFSATDYGGTNIN